MVLSLCVQSLSHVRLLATPWTVDSQAPLSMGFPRREYWSGLPFPSPGDLPNPQIELESLASPFFFFFFLHLWHRQADSKLPLCYLGSPHRHLTVRIYFSPFELSWGLAWKLCYLASVQSHTQGWSDCYKI